MIRRPVRAGFVIVALALVAGTAPGGPQSSPHVVRNPRGGVIESIDADGTVHAWPNPSLGSETTNPAPVTSDTDRRQVTFKDPDSGVTVDENGVIRTADRVPGQNPPSVQYAAAASSVTIDWMTITGDYSSTYQPGGTIGIVGSAGTYHLSDGSSWRSGAGSYRLVSTRLDHVEVAGSTIRYILVPPADGVLYQQTDFNSGSHSAQGTLGVAGPLVIEATSGSSSAVMKGQALIVSNDETYYGDLFNLYTPIVGSVVPFEVTYTLLGGTWTETTFTSSFSYSYSGQVDFAHPTSVPQVVALEIQGSTQVPDAFSVQFSAWARHENGILRDVTEIAVWGVDPAAVASVDRGVLVTQEISTPEVVLTLHAAYTEGGVHVEVDKTVTCVQDGSGELPEAWETYQGDKSHTGHVAMNLEPQSFTLRWQQMVGSGRPLNPVTAADGKVFVSLATSFGTGPSFFALDARDGATLWSKDFGSVFSVNPPSYAYGNVYIQTGNHGSDTYLRAYAAATGDPVFQAPHGAQWERYYAPTIFEGRVYVDGGYYGGMYSFDAFSGAQNWFVGLPQYDDWTPAVDAAMAYAYVGEYNPGVYAINRMTGGVEFMIPDPNFQWNGWSMDLAPVLGGLHDVLAIHNGRLISFDTQSRSIRWEMARNFTGQPSVARGVVYAIDDGELVALDEATGQQAWSWQSPEGGLAGTMVVTDTHIFATTAGNVYAVELISHDDEWSYPAAGQLALGEETLYIASPTGMLTAIAMPGFTPAALLRLEMTGPSTVAELSTAQYSTTAVYDDGRDRDRTQATVWSVEPDTHASFDTHGMMTTTELLAPTQRVVVRAEYTENGVTVSAEQGVDLVIGVTIDEFIARNLLGAAEIKQQVLDQLHAAQEKELAAKAVLLAIRGNGGTKAPRSSEYGQTLNHLRQALQSQRMGESSTARALAHLQEALNALMGVHPKPPAPPRRVAPSP